MDLSQMKYAIDGRIIARTSNLGDASQILGLLSLLESIGVSEEEIAYNIDAGDWVDEDRLTLVPSLPSRFFHEKVDCIHPVFVGSLVRIEAEVEGLKRYLRNYNLPFLCRDAYIAQMFIKDGYNAIRWGCPSLLLPRRKSEPGKGRIFYCDIPDGLLDFIPDDIKSEMLDLGTQDIVPDKSLTNRQRAEYGLETARSRLKKLRDNARLVITSRLHIAAPCVAMGIPVIMADDHLDTRRMALEPFIPMYSQQDFKDINWNPSAPDIEPAKKIMTDVLLETMKFGFEEIQAGKRFAGKVKELDNCLFTVKHRHLQPFAPAQGYVVVPETSLKTDNLFERIIGRRLNQVDLLYYGLGQIGRHFYYTTSMMVSEARTFAFADNNPKYKGCKIDGYDVIHGKDIGKYNKDNLVIVVTANGFNDGVAHDIANTLSLEFDLWEGKHFFVYEILVATIVRHSFDLTWKLSERSTGSFPKTADIWRVLPR